MSSGQTAPKVLINPVSKVACGVVVVVVEIEMGVVVVVVVVGVEVVVNEIVIWDQSSSVGMW